MYEQSHEQALGLHKSEASLAAHFLDSIIAKLAKIQATYVVIVAKHEGLL